MTEHRSFKRLVRARMEKTGESYTTARANLLAATDKHDLDAPLPTSDDAIRERTGRGWEEWFDMLDDRGAAGRRHRDISRWVANELGLTPLAWNVQAITVAYERARGGRQVGEREDGFAVSVSRTVAVPVERLFDAFVDDGARHAWLPDAELRERTATRPKSARYDWAGGDSRVHVTFLAKDDEKSTVALSHERLPDAGEAARVKEYWRERLDALKGGLER